MTDRASVDIAAKRPDFANAKKELGTFSGDRHYFNAELLQVTHRISCPAPERNSTATKPIDRLSAPTRGSACPSKLSSEKVPVPVRPQWGQQSATAQAVNAVIVRV
jgi:hypothetical protein